jgi:uncharacterized membrane protein (DUF106 family)
VISIILFGLGSILYFTVLILRYKKLEKSETFISINRFTLSKYKKKFFYWDLFDSIRKASFSVLTVFFKPMFLITVGIAIVFTGMMLQVNFIPYRKKFHNLMDYFILMSTLMTLFAGLLLFVVGRDGGANLVIDPGLKSFLNAFLPVITVMLIIGSNVVVISMFLFDVYVRRKKAKKRAKRKQKTAKEAQEHEQKLTDVLDDLHGNAMKNNNADVPWETEHDFKFTLNFEEGSEPEDASKSMNEILGDVLSLKRVKRKAFLISRAGKRAALKMVRKVKMENLVSQSFGKFSTNSSITDNDSMSILKMPNGFIIKSQYPGNVKYVGSYKNQNRMTALVVKNYSKTSVDTEMENQKEFK